MLSEPISPRRRHGIMRTVFISLFCLMYDLFVVASAGKLFCGLGWDAIWLWVGIRSPSFHSRSFVRASVVRFEWVRSPVLTEFVGLFSCFLAGETSSGPAPLEEGPFFSVVDDGTRRT